MTVSCLGDEVDIELEDDGTLLLSSLQANFTNGSGLIYYTDEGRKRSIRVSEGKLFPPRGKWGERTYSVITQIDTAAVSTSSKTSPQHVVNSTINSSSTINLKDTVMNTGDVQVCRTKQATLTANGNMLKLGPELVVSIHNLSIYARLKLQLMK